MMGGAGREKRGGAVVCGQALTVPQEPPQRAKTCYGIVGGA